jgi:aldehyde:ferredoxin oxidoreductase
LGGSIEELGISMTQRHEDGGKAANIVRHHHWRSMCNNLVVCYFAVVPPDRLAALLQAAVGQEWDENRMLMAGERTWNMKRLFNMRLGWSQESEKLPSLLTQPLPDGGQAGHVPDVDSILREYYAASGWDMETGWPGIEKLRELNLDFTRQP